MRELSDREGMEHEGDTDGANEDEDCCARALTLWTYFLVPRRLSCMCVRMERRESE